MVARDHEDSVVRLRAAWALGRIGDGHATGKHISAFRHGDWSVRMRAADALGRHRAHPATDALLPLLREGNVDVRSMRSQR